MLRKLVPIVVAQGLAVKKGTDKEKFPEKYAYTSQFEDDLIYMQNNFAGIGLWPVPVMPNIDAEGNDHSEADTEIIRQAIKEASYQRDSEFKFLGQGIESYTTDLCNYACPNRWVFRIALDVLVLFLLFYWLLSMRYCRLREILQDRFIYFVVIGIAAVLTYSILRVCDPFYRQNAAYTLIVVLMLILIGFILRQWIKAKQPKLP